MLRRFLGAHRAAAWGSPVGRRGPKSHCSFPSADFGRVHVFVWSMVARCQAIHHSFRASNITFRTHAGGRRVFPDAALEGSVLQGGGKMHRSWSSELRGSQGLPMDANSSRVPGKGLRASSPARAPRYSQPRSVFQARTGNREMQALLKIGNHSNKRFID